MSMMITAETTITTMMMISMTIWQAMAPMATRTPMTLLRTTRMQSSFPRFNQEIEQIAEAKRVDTKESIEELADTLGVGIKKRQRRLEVAHMHIGMNLIPLDEKTVARLTNYQRQINADISRHLNNLYRAQALRLGQPVAAPIAVDVNVVGEESNGLH
jgi:hypothetical protein